MFLGEQGLTLYMNVIEVSDKFNIQSPLQVMFVVVEFFVRIEEIWAITYYSSEMIPLISLLKISC